MSTPSSTNDGQSGRKEFFRPGLNQQPIYRQQQQHHQLTLQQQPFLNSSNITLQPQSPLLQQQQKAGGLNTTTVNAVHSPPPTTQFLHWANPLMGGPAFLQPTAQPQIGATSSSQQQQQHINDFFFNIQAQAAYAAATSAVPPPQPAPQIGSPSSPQETYSVLRVGNGNFLKIYHCAENSMNPLPGDTSFASLASYNQQQAATFHNLNSQTGAAAPPALQQQQQQQQPSTTQSTVSNNSTASPQAFNSYELFSSSTFTKLPTAEMPPVLLLGPTTQLQPLSTEDLNGSEQNRKQSQVSSFDANNMIIHNMPNNWAGNKTLCAQFQESCDNDHNNSTTSFTNNNVAMSIVETPKNDDSNNSDALMNSANLPTTITANITIQQQQTLSVNSPPLIPIKALPTNNSATATKTTEILRQDVPKKRIVAEVKPMRMTYSDVLSKFNNQAQTSQQLQNNQNNLNNNNSNNNTSTNTTNTVNRQQQKAPKLDANSNNIRRNGDDTITATSSAIRSSSKKSPAHDNKENQLLQQLLNNKVNFTNQKRSSSSAVINTGNNASNSSSINNNNNSSINKTTSSTIQKNFINNSKNNFNNNSTNNNYNTNDYQSLKKARPNKNSDNVQNNTVKNNSEQRTTTKSSGSTAPSNTTSSANTCNSTSNIYSRKNTKSSSSANTSLSSGQSRSRYQNNSNASYSYSSTKRGRNNSSYGTASSLNNSSFNNSSNRNYELAKRILQAWYTYTMKILTWLFYLVYDIVVLGCSILYERLTSAFEYAKAYAKQLHKDLKQNSNKPGIWFKNYCRQIDGKFSKTSKWAFWRRFFKKKPPETTSESVKTGRLPATGEEAMFQLLNCKGKDAYSILGVPPNSSQEQIRKHYKKIAVLVHPDKNKQAGAEEAFKVLQRAFELIGEPENRLAYDQSLQEALNAEKAWTELHDLLSQLQTKITEAANTIRCSTCGLRHPRKLTGRAHFAARECASCKIRHSAREGDIWAETSLLGLRWKYLALMEGKVYDITEWANCQKGALAHLEPNSHMVQYRIVRGAQQQHHQQKQQAQQQHQHNQKHTGSQYPSGGGLGGKFKRETTIPSSEASLHEFLDNLYSGQHPQQQQNASAYAGSSRRRNRRN